MKRSLEGPETESLSKRQTQSPQHAQDRTSQQGGSRARWCIVQPDGTLVLDDTRIKCFLSDEERNDSDLMQRILQGLELNAKVYPLIFDGPENVSYTPDSVRLRSIPFFRGLVADPATSTAKFQALSSEQRLIVATGVRDLFIADCRALLVDYDRALLKELVKLIETPLDPIHMNGMTLSFHPSVDFTILKFIEDLDTKLIDEAVKSFVPYLTTPKLFAVFVSAADLCYHNFENIVPLDSWFEANISERGHSGLSLSFSDSTQIRTPEEIYKCKLQGGATKDLLKELSSLDLFVPPLNKETRGGDRFIFHSSMLSKALTESVRSSGVLDKLANGELSSSFEFVNYVFRYNRFFPKANKFESHLDTPYYDPSRSHVSKYTLLIYLTSGHGDPTLRVDGVSLDDVEEMTCIIFDQRYEHEGRPFVDGPKVFLRTELIFSDTELQHDPTIGHIFTEACYMTSQSAFDQDSSLSLHAHECFERANALHWGIKKTTAHQSVYLWKQFQGINFVTNGYSYWFEKNSGIDVKDCAFMAVLDYLNCKIGGRQFRSRCASKKIEERISNNEEIWAFLSPHKRKSRQGFKRLTKSIVDSLLPKGPSKPFEGRLDEFEGDEADLEELDKGGEGCCPMHSHPMFNPWKSAEVMKCHETCCGYSRKQLLSAPLLLLDKQIVINDANIKIVGDKIFILRESQQAPLPAVNFAACWGDELEPPEFVVVGSEIPAPGLLLPPISFHESKEGYQLSLDFFRNDWMVRVDDKRTIPVPDITERPEDETPFSDKVPEGADGMEIMSDFWEVYREDDDRN